MLFTATFSAILGPTKKTRVFNVFTGPNFCLNSKNSSKTFGNIT